MSDNYSVINREIIIDVPIDKVFLAVSDEDQLTNRLTEYILYLLTLDDKLRRAAVSTILKLLKIRIHQKSLYSNFPKISRIYWSRSLLSK
jgi:hypothetical protein